MAALWFRSLLFVCCGLFFLTACKPETPSQKLEVLHRYPHDPQAFTQGLLWANKALYESTGIRGKSELRRVKLETGKVLKRRKLPDRLFGEGLALLKGKLYQLTWKGEKALVYDANTFQKIREIHYEGEGWGLTSDGENLIMSTGTSTLRFLNPETFETLRIIRVKDGIKAVAYLNELEWVEGEIFANVWKKNDIVRIDPKTGQVLGWLDCGGLLTHSERKKTDVFNGIAWDAESRRLFVTGKHWPWLFEVALPD